MCPLKTHEYSKNRTGAPPASCGAQPTWKTPSVACYAGEQIFQEQSTIPDKSGYYGEVVGHLMWQYSFSDRTLLKLMNQKKFKAHRAFFSAHICKSAALKG